ncbi:hypothetical protein ABBQ32_002391 [Trebouxia sp. C0010 RCD-2024]
MPDGQPAPVSHQHADDTSLHVLEPKDAQVALDTSIGLFCAASCSQLNAGKSQAFLVQAQPLASATVSTLPSISFITGQQTIKHLGVRLGYDMPAACHQTFTGIYQAIRAKLLQQISRQLTRYVASAQHQSQGDAAVALAQGNSQDSAALPASAPSAALFPRALTSSLPPAQGGVGLVEVPTQIQALQAKVVSRLLEPERLAWKVFQLHHLSRAPQASQLAYGATILFSTASTASLHLPARLMGYVTAFRALQPHRLLPVNAMPAEAILNEPLFLNQQIRLPLSPATTHGANGGVGSRPFTPQDQPLLLAAGITKVAHLQAALQIQHPQALTACLQSLLLALPLPWQAAATAAPTAPPWRQGHSASGTQLIQNTQTGQQHTVSPHCRLLQAPTQAISISSPMHVTPWDPSRPWRGPAQQSAQSTVALYSQGRLWGPEHLSWGVWGWGQQPAHQLVVRQASQRLRLIQARKHGILAPASPVVNNFCVSASFAASLTST